MEASALDPMLLGAHARQDTQEPSVKKVSFVLPLISLKQDRDFKNGQTHRIPRFFYVNVDLIQR